MFMMYLYMSSHAHQESVLRLSYRASTVKGFNSRKIPTLVPRKFNRTEVTDWTSIKLKRSCTNVATALLSSNIQLEVMMKLLGRRST